MEQLDAPPDASRPSDCALHSPAHVRRWRVRRHGDRHSGSTHGDRRAARARRRDLDRALQLRQPAHQRGSPTATANELGLRNTSFEVDDLRATIDQLAADGYGLVGGIGQYANAWRMAYVRVPEGIIVSLAERIGDA